MNERINELAIKAGGIWQGGYVEQVNGDSVYTDRKFVHGGDMDVEQFALLLVQECGVIADIYRDIEARSWPSKVMKQHFGVEE